jgi:uncharacterized protein with HEPN domain
MPSKRNPAVYFLDILRAIELIEQYLVGVSFADFETNIEKQDAVNRRLEILTEASHRLREEDKALCTETDWRAIRGLGNRLKHDYDSIELEIVWVIVEKDLPTLKQVVMRILREHFTELAPK